MYEFLKKENEPPRRPKYGDYVELSKYGKKINGYVYQAFPLLNLFSVEYCINGRFVSELMKGEALKVIKKEKPRIF